VRFGRSMVLVALMASPFWCDDRSRVSRRSR
jgi:hypothetical protein